MDTRTLHKYRAIRVFDFIYCFVYNEHLLLKKDQTLSQYFDTSFPEWEVFEAIIFVTIKKKESVKMGCFRTWYLLGVKKISWHAHKTGSWYLLRVLFEISDEHPRPLYMDSTPPPSPSDIKCTRKTCTVIKLL